MTKHKKHVWSGSIAASVLLIIILYVAYTLFQPFASVKPTLSLVTPAIPAAHPLPWPSYGQAAVGAVGYGVLATNGSQTPLATASLANIVTALLVLKHHPLLIGEQGPTITLSQADVNAFEKYYVQDGSVVQVTAGEQISEYQALQSLLLPSANNMADSLATWAFGSLDAYTILANRYVAQLGLTNTTITDPSGFLASTVSTAHDLTLLAQVAMQNPVLAQIVAQPSAVIPVQGKIYNYNFLLGKDNVVGIKTGNNDADPGAYLFAASQNVGGKNIVIVGAVMGAPDLMTALRSARPLIQAAAANFSLISIKKGTPVGQYKAPSGNNVEAITQTELTIPVWNGSKLKVSASLQKLRLPSPTGANVGNLSITSDHPDSLTYHVPVVLQHTLSRPSISWRLIHPF